jgi:peptidoglycan/LPS O-acetylase OafA/YrhL
MQYRSEIDGLRALAVLPVILFHAGFSYFSGGFVGVDIFFVISGYLITSIILKEIKKDKFSLGKFYDRRARRILPALFFVTFLCIPFAWLWLPPQYMEEFSISIIGVIFFVSNFIFWRSSGYFSSESELQPLLHTWSLAVEEQYYILFPLFLMMTWKLGRNVVLSILAIIFIFSITLADWASIHQPTFNFFLLPTRGWELLLGAFTAFYLDSSKLRLIPRYASELICFMGLILIIYSISYYDYMTPFPGRYAVVPTIGTALIILFAQNTLYFKSILGSKPLVGIGLVSYSAYLLHQPMLAFARHSQVDPLTDTVLLIICLLVFPFAFLIWKYIETPFRIKGKIKLKNLLFTIALSSTLLFTFGLFGKLTLGYEERLSDAQISLLNSATASPKRSECHTSGSSFLPPSKACQYPNKGGSWAVFGDSHGVELAFELSKQLDQYDDGLTHLTFSGCEPSFRINDPTSFCDEWTEQSIDILVHNENIQNIVIKYAYNFHLFDDHRVEYPGHNPNFCEPYKKIAFGSCKNYHEHSWNNLKELIFFLAQKKENIFLVLQTPELPNDIKRLIFNNSFDSYNNILGSPREFVDMRSKFVKDRLQELPESILVIDMTDVFCNNKNCLASIKSQSLYFDKGHPSLYSASLISARIMDLYRQRSSLQD